jgi:hypothetical protein
MKILIAYATRWGSTAKSAGLLADELKARGHEALAADARGYGGILGGRPLEGYDAYVLGSSIAAGQWKGAAKRLLPKLARMGKPVAVFVTAGGVIHGRDPNAAPDAPPAEPLEARVAKAIGLYIDGPCTKAGLKPAAANAFGGRMAMFGKEMFDSWDPEPIKAWAAELDRLFKA